MNYSLSINPANDYVNVRKENSPSAITYTLLNATIVSADFTTYVPFNKLKPTDDDLTWLEAAKKPDGVFPRRLYLRISMEDFNKFMEKYKEPLSLLIDKKYLIPIDKKDFTLGFKNSGFFKSSITILKELQEELGSYNEGTENYQTLLNRINTLQGQKEQMFISMKHKGNNYVGEHLNLFIYPTDPGTKKYMKGSTINFKKGEVGYLDLLQSFNPGNRIDVAFIMTIRDITEGNNPNYYKHCYNTPIKIGHSDPIHERKENKIVVDNFGFDETEASITAEMLQEQKAQHQSAILAAEQAFAQAKSSDSINTSLEETEQDYDNDDYKAVNS